MSLSPSALADGLLGLSDLPWPVWLLALAALLMLNARAGLPRSRRDLRLRGLGFGLFLLAAVLSLGRVLAAAWPWPVGSALLGALLAPMAAGWALRRGRWGLALLLGLSFPLFLLVSLTAVFGLVLNLQAVNSSLLLLAAVLSVWGAAVTWRTPRPAQGPAWTGVWQFGRGGFGGVGPAGRRRPVAPDDVVDIEARDVDAPPAPRLPGADHDPPR